jgi:hypothetical protein
VALYAPSCGEWMRTLAPAGTATVVLKNPRALVLRVPPLKRHAPPPARIWTR